MKGSEGILVTFTGWSGSGKTTFIEGCIPLLTSRGYRVYALKSTHMAIDLDTRGSDSSRFRCVGASGVCLLSGGGTTVFLNDTEEDLDRSRITALFPQADFILAEGYHGESDLRFEVFRKKTPEDRLKGPVQELDGIITNTGPPEEEPVLCRLPCFPLDTPEKFIQYLTDWNRSV